MVKTKCEIYSRVVGYLRPVDAWNDSKQAEFNDRHLFDESNDFVNEVLFEQESDLLISKIYKNKIQGVAYGKKD